MHISNTLHALGSVMQHKDLYNAIKISLKHSHLWDTQFWWVWICIREGNSVLYSWMLKEISSLR